ncbi:MAG: glycosyltransferase family 39 protein [Candidatus Euphemobacter frigidus]|nr:glycosyltransferase family 39 protein [Candidatus Euphemobacter frigidus]MDP8274765.1 glycosyltransferase family 39 protein [Candidatus Euphemobacter frigidus]
MSKYFPVIALCCLLLLLDIISIRHKTLTNDERAHYRYGSSILRGNSSRANNQATMPVSSLNAIPGFLGTFFPEGIIRQWLLRIETGRYITILISLLVGLLVFHWSNRLYGYRAALFSLFLYTFSPNIIAHSRLVTTDIYATGMITLTVYCAWRFTRQRSWKWALATAATLGISQLVKCTCMILYPIIGVLALAKAIPAFAHCSWINHRGRLKSILLQAIGGFLLLVVVSLVIINLGFLLNGSGTPLTEYQFISRTFSNLQILPEKLAKLPFPLPRPVLTGLDYLIWEGETGERPPNYLFGEVRHGNRGFMGYFFWAFLLKVPLATQLIILLAIVFYIKNRKRYRFSSNEIFLALPTVVFWTYINFFSVYNAGIRYSIMVFPLIFIFCGSLVEPWSRLGKSIRSLIFFLLLYLVVSVLSYFPHYISYFNELIIDRKLAYRVLGESNINWGQNQWYLKQYLKENPDAVLEPRSQPRTGKIVVTVDTPGEFATEEKYRWLRENFQPVGHIAYTYLIYTIVPQDAKNSR